MRRFLWFMLLLNVFTSAGNFYFAACGTQPVLSGLIAVSSGITVLFLGVVLAVTA